MLSTSHKGGNEHTFGRIPRPTVYRRVKVRDPVGGSALEHDGLRSGQRTGCLEPNRERGQLEISGSSIDDMRIRSAETKIPASNSMEAGISEYYLAKQRAADERVNSQRQEHDR